MDATHALGAAFFAVAGLLLVIRRRRMLDIAFACRTWNVPRGARPRIASALRRRTGVAPFATGVAGIATGCLSLAAAPLVLLTDVPFDTVLGALACGVALALLAACALQRPPEADARAAGSRRAVRVPASIWASAGVAAVGPLFWLGVAPIGALSFASGGLLALALAYRLATAPPVSIGEHPAIERFVERRVTTSRAAVALALGLVPAYVFELTNLDDATLARLATLVLCPLALGTCALGWKIAKRKPQTSGAARSVHAA